MKFEPQFLSLDDVLHCHEEEIKRAGGAADVHDMKALEAAIAAPQASYAGDYLMDLFEMAAIYVQSISTNHPFLDGKKRTAAVSAPVFLYLNGFELEEECCEGLADQVLALVTHNCGRDEPASYFKRHTSKIE